MVEDKDRWMHTWNMGYGTLYSYSYDFLLNLRGRWRLKIKWRGFSLWQRSTSS